MSKNRNSEFYGGANLEGMQTAGASIVKVELSLDDDPESFEGWGTSKREPGEVFDSQLGRRLALCRALADASDKVFESIELLLEAQREQEPKPQPDPEIVKSLCSNTSRRCSSE